MLQSTQYLLYIGGRTDVASIRARLAAPQRDGRVCVRMTPVHGAPGFYLLCAVCTQADILDMLCDTDAVLVEDGGVAW